MTALDDNLLGVDCVLIVSKVHVAVVALNHKLGDFPQGFELYRDAGVVHNQRRARWVLLHHLGACCWAVTTEVLIDDLSARVWLNQEGELGVVKCVVLGRQKICHNLTILLILIIAKYFLLYSDFELSSSFTSLA